MAGEHAGDRQSCTREINVRVEGSFRLDNDGRWSFHVKALSQDGRSLEMDFEAGDQRAENEERMSGILQGQMNKTVGHYRFELESVQVPQGLPLMSAAALNGVRRSLAEALDSMPAGRKEILCRRLPEEIVAAAPFCEATYRQNISNSLSASVYKASGIEAQEEAYEISHKADAELMRTKYCIRYELGMCPVHQGVKSDGELYLMNNGRRLALHFDCRKCEMVVCDGQQG